MEWSSPSHVSCIHISYFRVYFIMQRRVQTTCFKSHVGCIPTKTCESHVPLSKDVENQNARLTAFQCTYTKHSLNLSLHVAKVEAGNEELATFTSRHKFKELS